VVEHQIVLHFGPESVPNQGMRTVRSLQSVLVVLVLVISGLSASGEDIQFSEPLIHPSFDHLIPTSYPTIKPKFSQLRPTTRPLIHPGIPRVHITENLVNPFARPLLIVQ
jgi:hypothetical protein